MQVEPADPTPSEHAPESSSAKPARRNWVRRLTHWTLSTVMALVVIGLLLGCCVFSAPTYEGPVGPHFDGEHFFNPGDPSTNESRWGAFLRWRMSRDLGPWEEWVEGTIGAPAKRRNGRGELHVQFINHSTCLIQMGGLNILTDPVWSERVSPVSFAGPARRRAPGVPFEDLPPIDAVLISHNHYDHLDVPTLQRLSRDHRPRFFAGLGVRAYLEQQGIERSEDLDWWGHADLGEDVRVTFVPARHFSGRGLCDRNGTLWGGFVVAGPGGPVYFAGDTGFGDHFAEIRERLGRPRLALLPIGAFRPRDFMGPIHIDPAEAVRAHQVLGAGTSMGIHFGTFVLADDGRLEPVEELQKVLSGMAVPRPRFWALRQGELRSVPPLDE